ncbi:choline-responsive transcriptional repressor BetI [Aestuariibius insulae]|uniref:choline-binding transcriptional repressor BetI n=1 Tax=Aestuariibius insulae TaxID=2058287 RepID=UPI00345E662C
MPKTGMRPIRTTSVVTATIAEVGRVGSLDVTVSQIADKAGVSSALVHHYFGGKEDVFLAAMRHILTAFGDEVREALAAATTPRERLDAIIRASFSLRNFQPETISAWLNFYVLAQTSSGASRLLSVYHKRLSSNLRYNLRQLTDRDPEPVARGIAAMIDGLYLRYALRPRELNATDAHEVVSAYLNDALARSKSID